MYKTEHVTRRVFLGRLLLGSAGIFAGLMACDSEKKTNRNPSQSLAPAPKDSIDRCKDFTKVSAEDKQKRVALGYSDTSPMPDRDCANCKLFVPPKQPQDCGNCLLFPGPVYKKGYCTYWAPPDA